MTSESNTDCNVLMRYSGASYVDGEISVAHGDIVNVTNDKALFFESILPEHWKRIGVLPKNHDDITVDIVIVGFNSKQNLQRIIESRDLWSDSSCNIIIVDNASTDGTMAYLEKHDGIIVVSSKSNIGYGAACNMGASASNSPVIAFLNPDVVLDSHEWLKSLKKAISVESTAIVGYTMVNMDGVITHKHFPSWVCGACFGVSRAFFDSIGGFDTRYFMYYEETDLCRQAVKRGKNIVTLSTKVMHEIGASTKLTGMARHWMALSKGIFEKRWMSGRIVGMMIIGNEVFRGFFVDSIKQLAELCDCVVVLCDAPTDGTYETLVSMKDSLDCELIIQCLDEPLFMKNESEARVKLWELVVNQNPEYIVTLDADELFSKKSIIKIRENILKDKETKAHYFTAIHFWGNMNEYRVDGTWSKNTLLRIVRYTPEASNVFYGYQQHCGSFPRWYYDKKYSNIAKIHSEIGILHYGLSRDEFIKQKMAHYDAYPSAFYKDMEGSSKVLKNYNEEL